MSENRNAQYRYQVLDRCFSDWNKKYSQLFPMRIVA